MKNAQEPKAIETVSSSYSRRMIKKNFQKSNSSNRNRYLDTNPTISDEK